MNSQSGNLSAEALVVLTGPVAILLTTNLSGEEIEKLGNLLAAIAALIFTFSEVAHDDIYGNFFFTLAAAVFTLSAGFPGEEEVILSLASPPMGSDL